MRINREAYDFKALASTRGELEQAVQRLAKEFWGDDVAITLEVDVQPVTVQAHCDASPEVVGYEAAVHSWRQASGHVDGLMWGDDA